MVVVYAEAAPTFANCTPPALLSKHTLEVFGSNPVFIPPNPVGDTLSVFLVILLLPFESNFTGLFVILFLALLAATPPLPTAPK